MLKRIVAALLIAGFAAATWAACPPDRPYRCVPGMNGKMICGCGV
jgi:hypothetical protein